MEYDQIKMCNCAQCGREILGESMKKWYWSLREEERELLPQLIYCRANGRPYCFACGSIHTPPGRPSTRDDTSPWQENAIRHLEGE